MLGENIKTYRTNKGLTQEQLAVKLNVVRQTVSKWEKNLSVPDAEVLTKISDILEVSVSDLLGTPPKEKEEIGDIALQLQNLNELIATQAEYRRNIVRKVKIAVAVIVALMIIGAIYPKWTEIWHEFGQNLYRMMNS